ncbi:MAG: molybdopterin-dependent oxidoreductase [Nostocoides sp.]
MQTDHGPDAVAVYLGNPVVHSLGALPHGVPLLRLIGSKNVFSATSLDQRPIHYVAWALFGHQFLIPVPDLDRASYLLVVGGNPMASNGSIMTSPDFPERMRQLKRRGGRLVVLDPRRTETAKIADEHVFIRLGTDAWVLLAMINALLSDDLATPAGYVAGVEHVAGAVAPFTLELAESVSCVPAATVRRLAREFAASRGAAAYGRLGVSTQAHGTLCQWELTCLNALTGNLDAEGGMMFTSPAVDVVGRDLISPGHHGRWTSRVRGAAEFAGELPAAVMAEEMTTPGDGQVRALVTIAGNPVSSTPGGAALGEAIDGLQFRVAIDPDINETSPYADVILPPTGPLEREHYDVIFHLHAVRNTARWSPALFERPATSRHDWEILRDLCLAIAERRRARLSRVEALKERAGSAAKEARWRIPPKATIDLLLRTGAARLSVAALGRTAGGRDLGPLIEQLPERLRTQDRMVHLDHGPILEAIGQLAAAPPRVQAEDELLLIGRRHQRDNNSWMHNPTRLIRGKARHVALVHPDDLTYRGLASGRLRDRDLGRGVDPG